MPSPVVHALQTLLVLTSVATLPIARPASAAGPVDVERMVAQADEIRFPKEGFQVDIAVRTTSASGKASEHGYRVLSKGNERTLVLTTAPAADKGQMMLMRDADLWIFLPSASQPVRLPLSQKLTGQVANGDLARANFTGDYKAAFVREEAIDGETFVVLELTAARRGVTYHRVVYWVNKRSNWPYKAEFYTISKRLLKTAYYQKFAEMGGKIRPTRLYLEDGVKKGEVSTMDYSNMKVRALDDKIFTKQYLQKLK